MIILFKACARCHKGDVVVDKDMYGWNMLCLQCGYMKDLPRLVGDEADSFVQWLHGKQPLAKAG